MRASSPGLGAVVTWAASGIGLATAPLLAACGALDREAVPDPVSGPDWPACRSALYSAGKSAIYSLTLAKAADHARENIRVTA